MKINTLTPHRANGPVGHLSDSSTELLKNITTACKNCRSYARTLCWHTAIDGQFRCTAPRFSNAMKIDKTDGRDDVSSVHVTPQTEPPQSRWHTHTIARSYEIKIINERALDHLRWAGTWSYAMKNKLSSEKSTLQRKVHFSNRGFYVFRTVHLTHSQVQRNETRRAPLIRIFRRRAAESDRELQWDQ